MRPHPGLQSCNPSYQKCEPEKACKSQITSPYSRLPLGILRSPTLGLCAATGAIHRSRTDLYRQLRFSSVLLPVVSEEGRPCVVGICLRSFARECARAALRRGLTFFRSACPRAAAYPFIAYRAARTPWIVE